MSISFKEKVLNLTSLDHPDRPAWLSDLGSSLLYRFERLGDITDINRSIALKEEAVRLTSNDHPTRTTWLDNLGNSLLSRFRHLGEPADINRAVSVQKEAVRLTPKSNPRKPDLLNNLASSLLNHFLLHGDRTDIDDSIRASLEAVELSPDGHPDKPTWLYSLGNAFIDRFKNYHDHSDLSAAIQHFCTSSRAPIGPTSIRFLSAKRWIFSACLQGNSEVILDAYTTAIELLPQLAWLGLPLTERHRVLLDAADVVRDAAAAALVAGFPDKAVEWLEQGRSIVWSQLLQLRTPLDELDVSHPSLSRLFRELSQQLERSGSRSRDFANSDPLSLENEIQKHHALALRREKVLEEIRSFPDFERFLLPKTIKQLAILGSSGPIIYLNASKQRCDAFIVDVKLGRVVPVPLRVKYQAVERMLCLLLNREYPIVARDNVEKLNSLPTPSVEGTMEANDEREGKLLQSEDSTPDGRFRVVLEFLWIMVVNPVIQALELAPPSGAAKMPRIFWCPTGPFAFLPIHAAGLYRSSHGAATKLSDFAISSYIPTLGALAPSVKTNSYDSSQSNDIRLLTIPQPPGDGQYILPGVKEEMDFLKKLFTNSQHVTLQDSSGTVEDVTEKMTHADWVHFACHGVQDLGDPLDSGLCLADRRRLKLLDIIRLSRPDGGLAFLSACQTAQGDEMLPEESVHLAAGMLLAGYGGVIATMWSIRDRDAPGVARDIYAYLLRDGKVPESSEAAEALHYAVQNLRDSGVSFGSWVPFIHVGR